MNDKMNNMDYKMCNLKFSGFGNIYRFYPILKMDDFNINNFPTDMEEQGILGEPIELALIMNRLTLEYNDKQCSGKKGAYIKRQDYISNMLQPPFVMYQMGDTYLSQSFYLPVADNSKFKLRDLQLHKSYREAYAVPYGIIPTEISYQGVTIVGDPKDYERHDFGPFYPSLPILQEEPMPYFNLEEWILENSND